MTIIIIVGFGSDDGGRGGDRRQRRRRWRRMSLLWLVGPSRELIGWLSLLLGFFAGNGLYYL